MWKWGSRIVNWRNAETTFAVMYTGPRRCHRRDCRVSSIVKLSRKRPRRARRSGCIGAGGRFWLPILNVRSPKFLLGNSFKYSKDTYPGRLGKSLEEILVRVEIVKSGAVFPESLSADVGLFNPRLARLKPPLDHMFVCSGTDGRVKDS